MDPATFRRWVQDPECQRLRRTAATIWIAYVAATDQDGDSNGAAMLAQMERSADLAATRAAEPPKSDQMTTLETLTIHQIMALRQEAARASDIEMFALCTKAISGDQDAAASVVETLNNDGPPVWSY